MKFNKILSLIMALYFWNYPYSLSIAENLESENFIMKDATTNSGGEVLTGTNYSILTAIGDPTADSRLTSGSYELKSGFPNGIIANVPKITCFETTTNNLNSTCEYLPSAWGMQGECGYNGCYDRAKLEIDSQGNPIDTLYLVKIIVNATDYYLQSDHTLATTWDSSALMTKCQLEGRDPDNPDCDEPSDPGWNHTLQRYNVLGLKFNTPYTTSISAISGDFTQTRFGPESSATTTSTSIGFDLDIGLISEPEAESNQPYNVQLDSITHLAPLTSDNVVWIDINTNNVYGMSIYVKSENNGLKSSSTNNTIPSETEDLSLDPNNNGGYGLKTHNYTPSETAAGPLQRSSLYDTTEINEVGAVSSTGNLILFTNNTNNYSGGIIGGRGAILIKARAISTHPAAKDYNDTLTFIIIGNF